MKERMKGFISGFISAALIGTLSVGALAAAQTINVNGGVRLQIDGSIFTPTDVNGNPVDVFEYNGTTYVPVRAVSQAFGKEVAWDANTRTVIIGSNPSSGSYNRQNPAPINTAQTVTVNNILESYTATVSVTESFRGAEAWRRIQDANMFNAEAESGKEYILVKLKVTVDSASDDSAVSLSEYSFTAFSSDNVEYESPLIVPPSPAFDGDVYEGGTLEGYAVFLVDQSDHAPKLSFGTEYNGAGGIWFSLV